MLPSLELRLPRTRRRFASFLSLLLATVTLPGLAHAQQSVTDGAPAARPRLTKPPALLEFVEAEYPEAEKASGTAATVLLQIAISATGSVDEAAVIASAGPHFDAAALAAVRRFKFSPAEIDDQPAPVKITYRYQFTVKVEAPTKGYFKGIVRAKGTNAPLAGVNVELAGVGTVATDAAGQFSFEEVEPGAHRVTLSREDLTPLATEETFEAGKTLEATYDIELPAPADSEEEKDDYELVVVAPRLSKQVVSTEVSADEARRVPGTQGDVLKVVENLPGVARASAGSGEVVVWGASPQDTRTYVGAVRIPMLYHFGGLRSVVHSDIVKSVELIPGGYGAPYGRGLGGLVLVDERAPAVDRLHGSAQADLLDASAALTTPVTDDVSVQLSGRRSHIGDVAELLGDQSFQNYFTVPDYYDAQGSVRYSPSEHEYVELGGLLSNDVQERSTPSANPAERISETKKLSFQRVSFDYRKKGNDSEVSVSPWYGRDHAARVGDFSGTPTSLTSDSQLFGFRAEWRGRVAPAISATAGFDAELVSSTLERSGSVTSPPREGDAYVFGRAPSDQVNFDRWKTQIGSAAPYAELDFTPFGEVLHVTPGVRVEPFFVNVDKRSPEDPNYPDIGASRSDVSFQPRLAVRYAPDARVTFKGAFGVYRQPPLPDDLSAVFGNPLLGTSSGTHFLGGATYRLYEQLSVETTVFYTRSKDLSVRNPAASPAAAEALVQTGEGRSVGAQFLVRKDKGQSGFFGWIAYTILRSERRDDDSARWRLFDFDQTHVFTALAAYDLGAGFEVGARARVASGYPRTPVEGAYYDARKNRYEPLLGEYNSTHIPTFVQLDARVAKRFDLGGSELETYLDLQNVTNRENPEEIAYSPDYSERRYITGLPILPVLGARWSF